MYIKDCKIIDNPESFFGKFMTVRYETKDGKERYAMCDVMAQRAFPDIFTGRTDVGTFAFNLREFADAIEKDARDCENDRKSA